ncbi:MAG: hypothetical protein A4E64_02266 [Syntrophorhabdus sp. PtaU1.Bin058]|nr:MAG: hypothetical protein A4E64_02266 [Syntrophorhabdus sp. PtaU1.Bin058]
MDRTFLIIALLCSALIVGFATGVLAFRNEPDGYGGIVWGTDISALKGMKAIGNRTDSPDTKIYVREGDALRFGSVDLKGIEYEFFRGKFRSVTLKVKDLSHYVALKKEAFKRFGRGRELNPHAERYFWDGATSKVSLISAFDLS